MSASDHLNPNQFGYDGASAPTMASQIVLGKVDRVWAEENPTRPRVRNQTRARFVPIDKTAEKDKGLLSDHYETDDAPTRPRHQMKTMISPN